MTIITLPRSADNRRIEINLDGPSGNAFNLLGVASHLAERLRMNVPAVVAEMKAGDYEHLVATFDKYFGQFVTLYRTKPQQAALFDDSEGEGDGQD